MKMNCMKKTGFFLCIIQVALCATQHCHPGTYRCFWISDVSTGTWLQGRTTCQSEGGDLAVMETEELYDYVVDTFR